MPRQSAVTRARKRGLLEEGSAVVWGSLPGSVRRRSTAACTGIAKATAATPVTAHPEIRSDVFTT